jgi:transposase
VGKHSTPRAGQTIGVDVSDRTSRICVLDAAGRVEEEAKIPTTPPALRRWFGGRSRARVALEVGTHSPWMLGVLEDCGHEVLVANPRKLELLSKSDSKSDRTDAELLARVARADAKLLGPIRHRSAQAQADRAVLRARDALVRSRTMLVNHVRGSVKPFGVRISGCSTRSFSKRATELPDEIRDRVAPVLRVLETINAQVRAYDERIEAMLERYPSTQLLRQVAGVGSLTALAFVLTLDDPHRFHRSRRVGSYLGLRPRRSQSGAEDPQLHITRAGDPVLRRLLVHSAHYILGPFGPDTDLRRKGLALAARGGKNAKKRAVVAVARKLAVLLHHLWITGEVYEPLHNTLRTEPA